MTNILDLLKPATVTVVLEERQTRRTVEVDLVPLTFFEWQELRLSVAEPSREDVKYKTRKVDGEKVFNPDDPQWIQDRQRANDMRVALVVALALDKAGHDWGDTPDDLDSKAEALLETAMAGYLLALQTVAEQGAKATAQEVANRADGFQGKPISAADNGDMPGERVDTGTVAGNA